MLSEKCRECTLNPGGCGSLYCAITSGTLKFDVEALVRAMWAPGELLRAADGPRTIKCLRVLEAYMTHGTFAAVSRHMGCKGQTVGQHVRRAARRLHIRYTYLKRLYEVGDRERDPALDWLDIAHITIKGAQ